MDTSFLFQNCYTGTDFENLMVQFLGEHGFRAKKTGSNDGGIDIVATSITRPIKYSFNIQTFKQGTHTRGLCWNPLLQ